MQGGVPGRRQQRSVLLCCHCISALVGGVCLRESVVWRCSLNPRCTPTGLCHSLHVRVAAALSVCSHSICTQEHQNVDRYEVTHAQSSCKAWTCSHAWIQRNTLNEIKVVLGQGDSNRVQGFLRGQEVCFMEILRDCCFIFLIFSKFVF